LITCRDARYKEMEHRRELLAASVRHCAVRDMKFHFYQDRPESSTIE